MESKGNIPTHFGLQCHREIRIMLALHNRCQAVCQGSQDDDLRGISVQGTADLDVSQENLRHQLLLAGWSSISFFLHTQ